MLKICNRDSREQNKISYQLQSRLPKAIQEICTKHNLILAGGAIRALVSNTTVSDYDLFAMASEDLMQAKKAIKALYSVSESDIFFETNNAISFTYHDIKFQLVKKLAFNCPDSKMTEEDYISYLFQKFDFTVCMGAYSFHSDLFYYEEQFVWDNLTKTLIFNPHGEYPICSLYRTKKYTKNGFNISGVELTKIALAINNLKMRTYKDLKHQLQGIDTVVFEKLTSELIDRHGETAELDYSEFSKALMENALDYIM